MDTLLQLFHDHPLTALFAGVLLGAVSVLPFARGRLPGVALRTVTSLARIVVVPFRFWRRTILDLASEPVWSKDRGGSSLFKCLVPIMKSVLVLGGILILTAGFLSGWRASGVMRETGQVKAALRLELPELERTLEETRAKIAALDREWGESRECYREDFLARQYAEARRLSGENFVLGDFLRIDPQTKEVFSLLDRRPAVNRTPGEIAGVRAAVPALGLSPDKEWMLNRYLDNLSGETELTLAIVGLSDAAVRTARQPENETLRRTEAGLPPAIARVRADLAAPDQGRMFDAAAFGRASWPALFLFCGFVWVVGGLIEMMGSTVTLRGPARASVSEDGYIKWAE